jgi:hypothetical protein
MIVQLLGIRGRQPRHRLSARHLRARGRRCLRCSTISLTERLTWPRIAASDFRFAYFGTAAFAVRLLPLDQKLMDGIPMKPRRMGRDGAGRFKVPEMLVNIAPSQKFCIGVSYPQGGTLAGTRHWLNWRWPMPHYYFDIKDGHRFVDPSGSDLVNDDAAIAKAKVLAIGVSIDTPAVDPERHITVLNGSREEIFRVSVYSKPSMSNT